MTTPFKLAKDYKPYHSTTRVWYPNIYNERPVHKVVKLKESYKPKTSRKIPKPFNYKSLQQQSVRLGKSRTHFSYMKNKNPEKFALIQKLGDGDLVKGSQKYEEYKKNILKEFSGLYEILRHHRVVAKASEELGLSSHMIRYYNRCGAKDHRYVKFLEGLIKKMEAYIDENIHDSDTTGTDT